MQRYILIEHDNSVYIKHPFGGELSHAEMLALHRKLGETLTNCAGWNSTVIENVNVIERIKAMIKTAKIHEPKNRKGMRGLNNCVYFVGLDGLFKIGFTRTSLSQRTAAIAREMGLKPSQLYACLVFEVANPLLLERDLHIVFKEKRYAGEWFSLTEQNLDYVRGMRDV